MNKATAFGTILGISCICLLALGPVLMHIFIPATYGQLDGGNAGLSYHSPTITYTFPGDLAPTSYSNPTYGTSIDRGTSVIGTDPSDPSTFNGGMIDHNGKIIFPPQNTNPNSPGYNDLDGPNGPDPLPWGKNQAGPDNLQPSGPNTPPSIAPQNSGSIEPSLWQKVKQWFIDLFTPNNSKKGNPLIFTLDVHDKITMHPRYPDQCKLWNPEINPHTTNADKLWQFPAYNTHDVCMSLQIENGYVLYIDFNGDRILNNCQEMLCSFFWEDSPEYDTVYDLLDTPVFNANNNSWFDVGDNMYEHAMAWNVRDDTYHTMEELGIIGFNIRDEINLHDYIGNARYVNCDTYKKDERYWKAVNSGWSCDVNIAQHDMRVYAWNPQGILLVDGMILPTYDFEIGLWTNEQVMNAEIGDVLK